MTPMALKRERLRTISSVANGRNHLRRTRPTLCPSLRSLRIATFIGSASVPWPKKTISASSVMYSSRNGLSPTPEDAFEVGVRLADDPERLPHGLVVLHADLHEPVLVNLRRDRDRVVGVQQPVAEVERRQELVHRGLRGELHDLLRVGEERAVEADRDRERHALVLADAPGHE